MQSRFNSVVLNQHHGKDRKRDVEEGKSMWNATLERMTKFLASGATAEEAVKAAVHKQLSLATERYLPNK